MPLYKIREVQPGEVIHRTPLSDNKLADIRDAVYLAVKEMDLPEGACFIDIELAVLVTVARKIGQPAPFDMEFFQYNVEIKQRGNKES